MSERCPRCGRPYPKRRVGTTKLAKALDKRMGRLDCRTAAKDAGVDHSTFWRVLSGRTPDVKTFAALAKWLGVPMETLL